MTLRYHLRLQEPQRERQLDTDTRQHSNTVHEKFNDIPGCETDIDEILIWGHTIEEHDLRLKQVLNRVQEINMTLNPEKYQFRQTEVTYLCERLTQDGVKPDGDKLKAIRNYAKQDAGCSETSWHGELYCQVCS